ncbi:hypothetical protein [Amycolatopsis sp. FDAARGOS 1241]|uniref:hypothetical protein n=1 Tax=Amycolatopsis sp. FDAARGOS 1241 TaxID=2778070 RepID=UPI001EF2C5D9|nr:hypothetical protein [Amycolatopsis sp. FDAARGOS 1241]
MPFQCDQLRGAFPGAKGKLVAAGWRVLMAGALPTVLVDHGRALRALGITRLRFAADVLARFEEVLADVHSGRKRPGCVRTLARRSRPNGLI